MQSSTSGASIMEANELLRQLLDSNQASHDLLFERTEKLLSNQASLMHNQNSVVNDIAEIKENIHRLEEGRIADLEKRLKIIEEDRREKKKFWERVGKIGGGLLLLLGIVTGFLKIIGVI